MIFSLMNKDKFICSLRFLNGRTVVDGQLPQIFGSDYWLNSRFSCIIQQETVDKLLEQGITSIDEFYAISKGLSLNDTFWLKPQGCSLSWRDVNPYENPICTDFASSVLKAMKAGLINNVNRTIQSPDFTLTGSYDKKWKRIDGSIYLIKTGGESYDDREVFSELYAYHIAKLLGMQGFTVKYSIIKSVFSGKERIATKCKLFTSETDGFVPVEFINLNGKTDAEYAMSIGKDSYRNFLAMCLLDSIILNIDRHDGNFGYLVSNDEHTIGVMAPIFDNNLSLLCKQPIKNKEPDELVEIVASCKCYKQLCEYGVTFSVLGVWACRELARAKILRPETILKMLQDLYRTDLNFADLSEYKMDKRRTDMIEFIVKFNAYFICGQLSRNIPYNQLFDRYKDMLYWHLKQSSLYQ